ncbi:STAS domain-containing protein [Yinghuangia aomiensis]
MTPELTIASEDRRDWRVLRCSGRVEGAGVEALRHALRTAVAAGRVLITVDLTDIESCDAYGLAALVAGRRYAYSSGGRLHLVTSASNDHPGLDTCCLELLFPVFEAVEDATGSMVATPPADELRCTPRAVARRSPRRRG